MKNKLLFMMLTILGAPGIAASAGYDLANSEYNFAVNELSKSSFNQAAIIGQAGTNNGAQLRQGGSKLLAVVAQEGSSNRAKIDQTGDYNLAYIDQAGSANDASISQGAYGNTAMIIQKGSGNKANITQYGTQNGNCSAETVANGYSRDTTLISIRLLNQSDGGFT